ncbi:major facilitator superfamily domain-containing protein [Immersiella caudata]|uniref:Major facilitator superfamily domain-containing protein n=1 Tax=Immersiella caudata TaxID=314043 RepID=A0AA39TP00_9PEZI|nr:major facilitator superfamily domain-containing protein [Immersiella caudata]
MSTAPTPATSIAPIAEKPLDSFDAEKVDDTLQSSTETPVRSIQGFRWILICASIYLTAFLYGLDTTIAADIQGPVIEAFGQIDKLAWIGAGFALGSIAVLLFVGSLLNNFNMKLVYVGGLLMFEVGSVICGAAPNMNALIVGRVIAGTGGSGIYLGALNYFSCLTIPAERGLYIGLCGLHWGLGAVLGPVIGGAFAQSSATWRWAFYINLVIGAVVAPIFLFILPTIHPAKGKPIRSRLATIDFLGHFLVAATWALFTVAFSFAGIQWPWSDGRSIALVVVFGVLLLATIFQQYFTILTTVATRAVPGHLLPSRTQVLLMTGTAASSATLFTVVYFIPIYFQFVHGDGPIQAAIRLLPYIIILVVVNVLIGNFLAKIRYYMPLYLISGILITLGGSLLLVYLDSATSKSVIYGLTVIVAVGTGLTAQLGYAVSTLTVAPADIGNGLALQNIGQIGGAAVVLVISGQVFQSYAARNLTAALAGHGLSPEEILSVRAGAQSPVFETLSGELKQAATQAIVSAMQRSFALVASSGAIMILAAVGMKREKLNFGPAA